MKEPTEGNLRGTCYVCGSPTDKGHKSAISDAFTGFSHLTHGDIACEYCYSFFQNKSFRTTSWIATQEKVEFLRFKETRNCILNPPEPPFFLYITKGRQRQGWLSAMKYLSYSREKFYISTDWVDYFLADRAQMIELHSLVTELRAKGVSKTALLTGQATMKQTRTAIEENWEYLLRSARGHVGRPSWEVIVAISE